MCSSNNRCPPLFRFMMFDFFDSMDDMKAMLDGYCRNMLLSSIAFLLGSYFIPFLVPFRVILMITILCSSVAMLVSACSQTRAYSIYLMPMLFVLDAAFFLVFAGTLYQIGTEANADIKLNIAISSIPLPFMIWRIAADLTFFNRARKLIQESRP